ncbi:hypothetical protein AMTRI_Chr07g28440 [Amborella trichopoda]
MSSDVKLDVFVNGKLCKDPKLAQANDFVFAGLDKPGNTANPVGLKVTRERCSDTRPQHSRHLHGPHRLWSWWPKSSPHSLSCHNAPFMSVL